MTTHDRTLSEVRTILAQSVGPAALDDARVEACAAIDGSTITALEHRATVRVTGRDARPFLQGQLSCDLDGLTPEDLIWGAWCTPQGRVRAVVRAGIHNDALVLDIERELSAAIVTGLRRYVLRADVSFESDPKQPVRLGLSGDSVTKLLQEHWGSVPARAGEATQPAPGIALRREPGAPARFEVWCNADEAERLWSHAGTSLVPVGTTAWRLLEIGAGLPTVNSTNSERFLPQMLNLDLLDGVSFTKGCYPGQEVVARTQHLGRVKRRLYVARARSTDAAPHSGQGVIEAGGNATAGEVLDAARDADGSWLLSLVLNVVAVNRELRLDASDHPDLLLLPLPYGMPD